MGRLCYKHGWIAAPELETPGDKPDGPVIAAPRVKILAFPESQIVIGQNTLPIVGGGITETRLGRFGAGWFGGIASTAFVQFPHHRSDTIAELYLSGFTLFVGYVFRATIPNKTGIFGNWSGGSSEILFRFGVGPRVEAYIKNSSNQQYGPAVLNITSAEGAFTMFALKYTGTHISVFQDGVAGTAQAATGSLAIANSNALRIGYSSVSQLGMYGHIPFVLLLDKALPDAEIADISKSGDIFRYVQAA